MSARLYYTDATLLAFDAIAVAHGSTSSEIILDQSAFYPTSGGQPHDTGTLNGVKVIDVVDRDDVVVHLLESPLPLGPVKGKVDGARRRDHMQQHTAQHLLSAIAADEFGWETASVHFGDDHSTIEFGVAAVSDGQLHELERRANVAVAAAHMVTVSFEDANRAVGLRKATERSGEIRIITIEGVDRSACGGTHVASTAAIGAIVLHGVEKVRGHVRVGFVAGDRVLARLHARDAERLALAEMLSCSVDELPVILAKRQGDLKELRARSEGLECEVAQARLRAIGGTIGADEVRHAVLRFSTESASLIKAMVQGVAAESKLMLMIATTEPPAIHLGVTGDSGVNAGTLLKAALASVGGRGGGSPSAAQGTVPDTAALEQVINVLSSTTPSAAPSPRPD